MHSISAATVPSSATIVVNVKDIKSHKLPAVDTLGLTKRSGKFYVKLILDGRVKKTSVTERGKEASWTESFQFETHGSSVLELQVYAKHQIGRDDFIGGTKGNIDSLLTTEGSAGVVTRELYKHDANGVQKLETVVEFTIVTSAKSIDLVTLKIDDAVAQGKNAVELMKPAPSSRELLQGGVGFSTPVINNITPIADTWDPFLQKIKLFTEIVDKITEVHPYAKMTWSILSATPKIIITQMDRDERIVHLVEVMDDVYSFVQEAEPLNKIKSHEKIVALMAQQTIECAYFIRDYAVRKSFWKRTFEDSFISNMDSSITRYENKFEELKMAFQDRAILETGIVVSRILGNLESIGEDLTLSDMPYAKGACFDSEKGCMPGTREGIIGEICQWINSPDSDDVPRMFFLSGVAGCGKSAIAHAVAGQFDQLGRLGSSYCFSRADQAQRRPTNLLSTIALDIADLDPQWKTSLCNVVKGNRSLRTTLAAAEQFNNFILEPAKNLTTVGPILVVIDALDESGDQSSRRALLDVLVKRVPDLPPNFRILLTARPEPDIFDAFGNNQHIRRGFMETIDRLSTDADISRFIQAQLSDIRSLEIEWPNKLWCRQLVESSDGLFQWASTACRAIKDGRGGLCPTERLCRFVSSAHGLDGLYAEVLVQAFDPNDSDVMSRFAFVMGRILAAKEPLSVTSHSELCDEGDSADLVELIVLPLASLLSGVTQPSVPVQALHTSFPDFLTNKTRSRAFYVDLSPQNWSLALACLRVMKTGLRFNICGLETSHLANADVSDLPARVIKYIPASLSYASRFWEDHLREVINKTEVPPELRDIMYTRLLNWLEVLSLIGAVSVASPALLSLVKWAEALDEELAGFAKDANNFVSTFRYAIAQSAPHIYLSGLPFAPTESRVSKRFLHKFPNELSVDIGKLANWPVTGNVFEGHTNDVNSVAYSPDGKRVASGSYDHTVRVWDAETGEVVSGPFEGHTKPVRSVAYSPDGRRVVSGSEDGTVRVWDAETGELVSGPFQGHTQLVWSVAYSPDGKRIASGSVDQTVRVWDAETGELVSGPFEGHTSYVMSAVYSPDGKRIASGSYDQTVRVWDAETGELVSGPFEGHTSFVVSVAYSPDGQRIASGSVDRTVRVWDAETGEVISGPFEGHANSVISVAYSPDARHIASGSYDQTVRVWDAETGELVSPPFEGHTGCVSSVAYSPDGRHIASGSFDHTVRVWNLETGEVVSEPFEGHTGSVSSVAYSRDGRRIASGSFDHTVRVWNSEMSELVSGPFEGHTGAVLSVAYSPDGRHIASGSFDHTVRVWDAETGEVVSGPFEGYTNGVNSVTYSPDGKRIASGSSDHTVRVWDAETGELVSGPFEGHTNAVCSVAYSPDGQRIASGSGDQTVRVWDAKTGKLVSGPFNGHTDVVRSVAYSPDGKRIASGSPDQTVRVWDAETGELVSGPFDGHTNFVLSVAYSPDGRRIASGSVDRTVRVWDAETGELVSGPFEGHTNFVNSVAYSPDGRRIASGSVDQTIRVWDTDPGELMSGPFEGHTNGVQSVAHSPDGKRIILTSLDLAMRVCDAGASELSSVEGHASFPGPFQEASPPRFLYDARILHGWMLGAKGELLFWVPPFNRKGLWHPRNTAVIGRHQTRLSFRNFVHGTDWHKCQLPLIQ